MSKLLHRTVRALARRLGFVALDRETHARAEAERERLDRECRQLAADRDELRAALDAARIAPRVPDRAAFLAADRPADCVDAPAAVFAEARFVALVRASAWWRRVPARKQQFAVHNAGRLCRILDNLALARTRLSLRGPCLDVGSMHGLLAAPIRAELPELLPYACTEYDFAGELADAGAPIACTKFDCERDVLALPAQSVGVVLFHDVLEHLLIDPVWTLVQLNRVLRTGGHVTIATPNAIASYRFAWRMLRGQPGATENEYKAAFLYDRHNREYAPADVAALLRACGFAPRLCTTHAASISDPELCLLAEGKRLGLLQSPAAHFGPELFVVGEKVEDVPDVAALPAERRWPAWLYTDAVVYHARPEPWPVLPGPEDAAPGPA